LVLAPVEIPNSLARQEVDVNFKDATLEELLDQLSQASGLKITLEGTSLVVEQADR
jgi:type II secretory pathway component GspD/PulD (secretin)